MLENNRQNNLDRIRFGAENYGLEEVAIYDQCFTQSDKDLMPDNVVLIGHEIEPKGFIVPRNALFKWFYESDYDYALCFDAHDKVSKPSLNDLQTVVSALKSCDLKVNAVMSSTGIWISQERMQAKQRKDYKDVVWILRSKKDYEWLHGTIICNFKKRYGITPYIDSRCDNWKGTPEDMYFIRLLRRLFPNQTQIMPSVVFSEPSNKESTWMNEEERYNYPAYSLAAIDRLVDDNVPAAMPEEIERVPNAVAIPRLQNCTIQYLKPYRSRSRKK